MLAERDEELRILEELLAEAVLGNGKIAMVTGAVGTGKSALLRAFAGRAIEQGALSVYAAGSQAEMSLPLALLNQLLHDMPMTDEGRQSALELLREYSASVTQADPRAEHVEQVDAQVVDKLCAALLDYSSRCPLVISIDDVHYADWASMLFLSYLMRRMRTARILMVFSQPGHGRPMSPHFEAGLRAQPHSLFLSLSMLTVRGAARMADEVVDHEAVTRLAKDWHAVSGGNPLLMSALLEDHQAAARGGKTVDSITVGPSYGRAVLSCLHRGDPGQLELARALAVLGESSSLGRLTHTDTASVERALDSMESAGLLSRGSFRHPAARAAVQADMEPGARAELHRMAATLGYESGTSAGVVAEHLLAASETGSPWVENVLEEAAWQALADGHVESAIDYLRLAVRACRDEQRQARLKTMLVRAEWRINPNAPVEYLAELAEAARSGHLRGSDTMVLAKALLWHGKFDSARDALKQLGSPSDLNTETIWELLAVRPWLRCLYPSFLTHLPQITAKTATQQQPIIATTERHESASALATVLTRGPKDEVFAAIERILRSSGLDDISLDTVECGLLALIYGDRPQQAAQWCDMYIAAAAAQSAPSREARLRGIRAEISIRLGDLPAAEQHARAALKLIPPSSWGVAVGTPLSSLLLALTAMGHSDPALVNQPVPDAMLQSRHGLHYLYARGRHHLAADNPRAALRDFQTCGELMQGWNMDMPGLVPWRLGAAEVFLATGEKARARKLIEAHLERCGSALSRARGMGLRLLAATLEPRLRPLQLRRAAEVLESAGDRYELAQALVDLTESYQSLGELRQARTCLRRASHLARECGAEPLSRLLAHDDGHGATGMGASPSAGPAAGADAETGPDAGEAKGKDALVLSDAERRVCALAAEGYTNREIAGKLYVTVSTVEQHLTRIYRKLNVTRRTDLPPSLEYSTVTNR